MPQTFRMTHVTLENFRCFEKLEMDLHPECTLLVGVNGAGKSAALAGLVYGFQALLEELEPHEYGCVVDKDQRRKRVRVRKTSFLDIATPMILHYGLELEGSAGTVEWSIFPFSTVLRSAMETRNQLGLNREDPISRWVGRLRENDIHESPATFPLVASYSVGRGQATVRPQVRKSEIHHRTHVYRDALDASSGFEQTATWIRRATYGQLQRGEGDPLLAAVGDAVNAALEDEGVTKFSYDVTLEEMTVRFGDGRELPLSLLSDGYRTVVSLVADIARRAAQLNPHLGEAAPAQSPGIVLIDEIDLHLHPSWQRRILPALRRTFPCIQFIATTHSPQVIASVERECLRILDGQSARSYDGYVQGRDSNSILAELMGTPERPPEAQQKLHELAELIDKERWGEARALVTELEKTLGASDSDLVSARFELHGQG